MGFVQMKKLETEEVIKIYEEKLVIDFPLEEQKPLSVIISLMKQELYFCYGLIDDFDLVAYAFFAKAEGYRDILIDYLAVSASTRGKGYGSQFLTLMKEELKEYDSIIFEVESGKSAQTSEEIVSCQKRLDFYHKNGLVNSSLRLSLFEIDMMLLYLPLRKAPSDEVIENVLNHIYDEFYGLEVHKDKVIVYKSN